MTTTAKTEPLPSGALLERYRSVPGEPSEQGYTDCYALVIDRQASLAEYLVAFYTTPIFKIERFILTTLVAKPSSDDQVRKLACGDTDQFAAWQVEARQTEQILLCDFRDTTRSWLMVEALEGSDQTMLYFGSAVVHTIDAAGKIRPPSLIFRLLLGFHRLYSRILLSSAARKLMARENKGAHG